MMSHVYFGHNLRDAALEGLCRIVYTTCHGKGLRRPVRLSNKHTVALGGGDINICPRSRSEKNKQRRPSLHGKWLSSSVAMAAVQQCQALCQGCLGWTWALRTLCHCHAGMNIAETGPSISVLPSDYEQITQPQSMLYITGYALLFRTPVVPKLKDWPPLPPPASELTARLASNQICYVPPTRNSSLRCDLYLFLLCTDVHYDTDVIQWLDEINGVYTHMRKQLLGGMCLFSVHRVILNDW